MCVIAFAVSVPALAGRDTPGCVRDRLGEPVCAPPLGSIAKDMLGEVVCGTGQCRVDHLRRIVCSAQPGGAATLNRMNQVVCIGGCELASQERCQRPQPLQEQESPQR
ncbi:hypothetical protein BurJ1DRAFT_1822 [Burkholderiales bacterium JOSHI_001]|nr:hypothetical protein BurJ1DRAFT_1822 [Burkholderiales bacterium JOSHI_001]